MNPDQLVIQTATGPQCATLAGMVAVALTKKFEGKLSFIQAQIAITDKSQFVVNELAEKFANEIYAISIDPHSEEIRKISHFYKTCFKDKKWKNPDFEHAKIPMIQGNLKRPEFIFSEMSEEEAFNAFSEFFNDEHISKEWKEPLTEIIDYTSVQKRPKGNYVILHACGNDPEITKSFNECVSKKIIFMTPIEGIITIFRSKFESREVIHNKHLIFSALDSVGCVIGMHIYNGGSILVDSDNSDFQNSIIKVCF